MPFVEVYRTRKLFEAFANVRLSGNGSWRSNFPGVPGTSLSQT